MIKFKSMESQITMTRRLLVDLEAAQVLHAYISLSLSLSRCVGYTQSQIHVSG